MESFWSNYQFGSSLDVWFRQPINALVDGTQVPKSMLLNISWIMVFTLSVLQNNRSFMRTQNGLLCEDTDQSWTMSEVYQPKSKPKYGTGNQDLKACKQKLQSDNYKKIQNELNLNKSQFSVLPKQRWFKKGGRSSLVTLRTLLSEHISGQIIYLVKHLQVKCQEERALCKRKWWNLVTHASWRACSLNMGILHQEGSLQNKTTTNYKHSFWSQYIRVCFLRLTYE